VLRFAATNKNVELKMREGSRDLCVFFEAFYTGKGWEMVVSCGKFKN
jgi:hypothetical protein